MRETGPKYGLGLAAQVAQLPVHFRVDNGLGLQLRDGTIEANLRRPHVAIPRMAGGQDEQVVDGRAVPARGER